MEIVSEPDLRSSSRGGGLSPKALRDILVYLEVCDGNMEEGSFRCDANVSLRPVWPGRSYGTKHRAEEHELLPGMWSGPWSTRSAASGPSWTRAAR